MEKINLPWQSFKTEPPRNTCMSGRLATQDNVVVLHRENAEALRLDALIEARTTLRVSAPMNMTTKRNTPIVILVVCELDRSRSATALLVKAHCLTEP